jgi:anthranilate synthase component 2
MALRHKKYDLKGMQFHPESVLTPMGEKILENWLNS